MTSDERVAWYRREFFGPSCELDAFLEASGDLRPDLRLV